MSLSEVLSGSGLKVCCAESCTGGLIGAEITSVPGSSEFFMGSAVTYSNDAKESLLKVPAGILAAYGAVSPQTAVSMARGARKLFGADVAVAVTGIAGPGGATDTKPVGLVYVAVSSDLGDEVCECRFSGDRESVRRSTVGKALELLEKVARSVLDSD